MTSIKFEEFIAPEGFAHLELLKEGDEVWSPLRSLLAYLEQHRAKIEIKVPKHVILDFVDTISIGAGTLIEPGVYIQGPCIIGKNCILRHGAYLRGGVILGDRCVIGHAAEVKHSILFNDVAATHFTYVGDSVLGNRVNLGAGVKCANLRFDRRPVKPGFQKLGACVGDQAQIGCNAVLNPGTLVGKGAIIYPLQNVGGVIVADGSHVS